MPLPVTTGLISWLRADLGTFQDLVGTIPATADGDPVRLWKDQTPNPIFDVNNAADNNRPLLKLAVVNGQAVLRFDGTDDYFKFALSVFVGTAAAEAFLVVKKVVSDDAKGYWQQDAGGNTIHHRFTDLHMYDGFMSTVRKDCGTLGGSLAAWRLYNVSSALNAWTNRLDGTQVFTTATNTVSGVDPGAIGRTIGYNGATYLSGDIAEFIVYNAVLSTNDRNLIGGYVQDRYGITVAGAVTPPSGGTGIIQGIAAGTARIIGG